MSAVTVPPVLAADGMRADGVRADGMRADGMRADNVRADGVRADGVRADSVRAAQARAVLDRAEERTGASRWVRPVRAAAETPPQAAARLLPVDAALAGLLPSGGLDRGSTVVVAGSTSLVLALLAASSQTGGWVALVGLPTVGVLAAHQLGLDLDRTILVPSPGADGPTVVAALLDGVDVVVVGPHTALGPADHRRLSARARERSAVLLPTTPWPGAHVVLTAEVSRWEGLGRGHGRLRSRRLVVRRGGRGMSAQERASEVTLPAAPQAWGDEVAHEDAGLTRPAGVELTGPAETEIGWLAG